MSSLAVGLALAQFAPSIMRFFGAGQASVKAAEKVVGIAQAVTGAATPEAALEKLRADAQLAQQFQLAVLSADTDLEKSYLADVQDARVRDLELRKITGGRNTRADVMVVAAALGMVSCLAVLVFFREQVPGEVVGIISTIAGIFGACLRDAYTFEFGRSRSEQEKDREIVKWAGES